MILHIFVSSFCQGKFVFDFIGIQQCAFMGILFSLFCLFLGGAGKGEGFLLDYCYPAQSPLSEYDYKANKHKAWTNIHSGVEIYRNNSNGLKIIVD